jgi:uncharacterized membrane protein YraQ (UPF0718 family)
MLNLLLLLFKPDIGMASFTVTVENLQEMMLIMPPIFILLGLLDVWVQKETMIKLMGENSGLLGIFVAFLLGSVAAGPLYVAFPFVGVLIKKGCNLFNILIFVRAWSATKIPISIFEASVMGWKFMLTRYMMDIPVIILIAYIVNRMVSAQEKEVIMSLGAQAE